MKKMSWFIAPLVLALAPAFAFADEAEVEAENEGTPAVTYSIEKAPESARETSPVLGAPAPMTEITNFPQYRTRASKVASPLLEESDTFVRYGGSVFVDSNKNFGLTAKVVAGAGTRFLSWRQDDENAVGRQSTEFSLLRPELVFDLENQLSLIGGESGNRSNTVIRLGTIGRLRHESVEDDYNVRENGDLSYVRSHGRARMDLDVVPVELIDRKQTALDNDIHDTVAIGLPISGGIGQMKIDFDASERVGVRAQLLPLQALIGNTQINGESSADGSNLYFRSFASGGLTYKLGAKKGSLGAESSYEQIVPYSGLKKFSTREYKNSLQWNNVMGSGANLHYTWTRERNTGGPEALGSNDIHAVGVNADL